MLTEQGQQLLMALGPLAEWSEQWARNVGRRPRLLYAKECLKHVIRQAQQPQSTLRLTAIGATVAGATKSQK